MIIRGLQRSDIDALERIYPDADADALYIQHLQAERSVYVALDDDDIPLGYGVIQWISSRTYFWRRNIPEVIALCGSSAVCAALLRHAEQQASTRGYAHLGIHESTAVPAGYEMPAADLYSRTLSGSSE